MNGQSIKYIIDCPEMNNQSRNASDPIVKKIKEHKWTDWRKSRFESFDLDYYTPQICYGWVCRRNV